MDSGERLPSPDDRRAFASPRLRGILPIALLYLLAAGTYVALGHLQRLPLLSPDEFLYGHLGRSIADGDGWGWRGQATGLRTPLYVLLIAPAWKLHSELGSYDAAKAIGAIVASAVVLPTWLLARRYVEPTLAMLAALLSVAGAVMVTTSGILTENLAYPLASASLAAMVAALARPGSRWALVALATAALAAAARAQLVVLVPIFALALLVDLSAGPARIREGVRAHRALCGVLAALLAGGALLLIAASDTALGLYRDVSRHPPSLGDVAGAAKDQLSGLLVASGMLPVLVVLAASLSRVSWRDPRLRPLLAVTWSAALALVLESAWFDASADVSWSIERYVMYALPLFAVAMVSSIAQRRVAVSRLLIALATGLVLVLLIPGVRQVIEEPTLFGLNLRAGDLVGSGVSTGLALALWTALAGGAAALVLSRGSRDGQPAALRVGALTLAVLLVAAQATWSNRDRTTRAWRAAFPSDLAWIEHDAGGPVARFISNSNSPKNEITEFFNRGIERVYIPQGRSPYGRPLSGGATCTWSELPDGTVTFEPACGGAPPRLLFDDDAAQITFYGERLVASRGGVGRVVALAGAVKLRGVIVPPCSNPVPSSEFGGRGAVRPPTPKTCSAAISGQVVLERPGQLVLTLRGGAVDRHVAVGAQQQVLVAAGQPARITIPAPAGASSFVLRTDWQAPPPQEPALVGARLVQGSDRSSLTYP